MNKKIILFNGPPSSGKDTLGKILQKGLGASATIEKFAKPLKTAVAAALGLNQVQQEYYFETQEGKASEVHGFNCRKALIDFSEEFSKPRFGDDIFGKLMVDRISNSDYEYTIITDCGFETEVKTIVDSFGSDNVVLFKLRRKGCSFKEDSRTYLNLDGVKTIGFKNDSCEIDETKVLKTLLEYLEY